AARDRRSAGFRQRSVLLVVVLGSAYLRPTTRFTGKFRRLTAPGLGLWPITRPGCLERARRMVPTLQCALRMRTRARPSVSPTTLGTRQRTGGGGGGGGGGRGGGGGGGGGGVGVGGGRGGGVGW